MTGKTRISLAVFGLLAVVMGGAALAWACTTNANIQFTSSNGPAGSEIGISGSRWGPNELITVRWDSMTGEVLGTVTTDAAGNFDPFTVTIPDAAEDTYVIVATGQYTSQDDNGQTHRVEAIARQPYTVTNGTSSNSVTTGTASGTSGQTNTGPSDTSATAVGEQRPARQASTDKVSGGVNPTVVASDSATTSTGAPAFPGSLPSDGSDDGRQSPSSDTGRVPSFGTVTGDLGSGFASGAPSLLPGLSEVPRAESNNSQQLIFGVALVALGLLALGGGVFATEMRRRRVSATQ